MADLGQGGKVNTCKTCRFWIQRENQNVRTFSRHQPIAGPQELKDAAELYGVGHVYETRECTAARFAEIPAPNGSAIIDGSEYWAGLFTGEDFGCVQWKGLEAAGG